MSASSSRSSMVTRPRFCSKKCIRVESCENGDTVLVIWNQQLCRYTIVQESTFTHFLAEDSHPLFNLPVPSTREILFENIEKPNYFFGTVTEKQYCMVKREGTRYRVPIGTKFCRIKVKPLSPSSRHSVSSDHDRSSKKGSKCKSIYGWLCMREPTPDINTLYYFPGETPSSNRTHLPVTHSQSIQMIDSFAQTEVANSDTKLINSLVDGDMVDSGVVAQVRQSDRISLNEDDEGAVSMSYDDRYRCVSVSEEDVPSIVDNRSSQEVSIVVIDKPFVE